MWNGSHGAHVGFVWIDACWQMWTHWGKGLVSMLNDYLTLGSTVAKCQRSGFDPDWMLSVQSLHILPMIA